MSEIICARQPENALCNQLHMQNAAQRPPITCRTHRRNSYRILFLCMNHRHNRASRCGCISHKAIPVMILRSESEDQAHNASLEEHSVPVGTPYIGIPTSSAVAERQQNSQQMSGKPLRTIVYKHTTTIASASFPIPLESGLTCANSCGSGTAAQDTAVSNLSESQALQKGDPETCAD